MCVVREKPTEDRNVSARYTKIKGTDDIQFNDRARIVAWIADSSMSNEISGNRKFAEMVGLITMHWNKLHDLVRQCFPAALGGNALFTGPALDAIKSDATQRDVVLAVLMAVLASDQHTGLRQRANALFKNIGNLSGERNGFIHSSWARVNDSKIQPSGMLKKVHRSLNGDPLEQGHALLQAIYSMQSEVMDLMIELQTATAHQSHH